MERITKKWLTRKASILVGKTSILPLKSATKFYQAEDLFVRQSSENEMLDSGRIKIMKFKPMKLSTWADRLNWVVILKIYLIENSSEYE